MEYVPSVDVPMLGGDAPLGRGGTALSDDASAFTRRGHLGRVRWRARSEHVGANQRDGI